MNFNLRSCMIAQAIRLALLTGAMGAPLCHAGTAFQLSSLNGANGFRLDGRADVDMSGHAVAPAGDVNGDGHDDLIIGAPRANPNGYDSGCSYVVFGRAQGLGFDSTIDLSSLDGSTGFKLNGVTTDDLSGWSVAAAGDINGDGIGDVVVGAYQADPNGNSSGSSYVMFGRSGPQGFAAEVEMSSLNGSNGFRLDGEAWYDKSGLAVSSAGDINGDGVDDVVVGAHQASHNGTSSGSSYVVFGRSGSSTFASSLNLGTLNGSNGFRLEGGFEYEHSGAALAAAGDVNGDGIDDLLVGAYSSSQSDDDSGSSYVLFGRSGGGFPPALNLGALNGSNGFRMDGIEFREYSGFSVAAAGDINSDGIGDMVVGAPRADANGEDSGSTYVLFGSTAGFASTMNFSALDGSNGFRIMGGSSFGRNGRSVAGAGDFNGDSIDDLLVGEYLASPNGEDSGSSYVIYGRSGANAFPADILLSTLGSDAGFRLDGDMYDRSGRVVAAAGDINDDGLADLIIGASGASPHGTNSGSTYVVFGALPDEIFANGFETQ